MSTHSYHQFFDQLDAYPRLWVLTGAGLSAASGIPTYRNHEGHWMAGKPIQHIDFVRHKSSQQRYWARSIRGWPSFSTAQPNAAHHALAELEQSGRIHQLVTQNVDSLHSQAGHDRIIDLHGRLNQVVCIDCKTISCRHQLQSRLVKANPQIVKAQAAVLPDGDAQIDEQLISQVCIPTCLKCNGTIKPNVVFFGDNVPAHRVDNAYQTLSESNAVLVIGTSLQVLSGYRFCIRASKLGIPVFCINQGITRADDLYTLKLQSDLSDALVCMADQLTKLSEQHNDSIKI